MLRKLATLAYTLFLSLSLFAQAPTVSLSWEEVPIDPAVLPEIEGQIGAGAHTYRVYYNLPDFWEIQAVYAEFTSGLVLSISTSTSFYQNTMVGGPTPLNITEAELTAFPSVNYDSWLTIGEAYGENSQLSLVPFESIFADFEAGNSQTFNDFLDVVLFVAADQLIAQNSADENGRVLIGQFTTTGSVDLCINSQVRRFNPDGTLYIDGSGNTEYYNFENQCINIPEPQASLSCTFDLDDNGHVQIGDLLTLLTFFGCQSGCQIDVNGDGDTGIEEIIAFLTVFDTTCD